MIRKFLHDNVFTVRRYEQKLLLESLDEKNKEIEELTKYIESIKKDMQNMVSNVTHDLKSPLSAVSSGICIIKEASADCKRELQSSSPDLQMLRKAIDDIEDAAKKMNAMNTFMFSSINHVLDCSKVQNGMKLTPKNETTNIVENLELPISCMRDYQDKINIQLLPLKSEICSYIITDSLWFQENLLCLLSNAVKYSGRGTITISLSLIENTDVETNYLSKSNMLTNESQTSESTNKSVSLVTMKDPISSYSSMYKLPTLFGPSRRLNKIGVEEVSTLIDDNVESKKSFSCSGVKNQEKDSQIQSPEEVSSILSSHSVKQFHDAEQKMKREISRRSTIEISKTTSNLMLVVEVQDEGIGISEDTMKELFSPFKQAQRLAGGTGLGLYSLSKRSDAIGGQYGVRARSDGKQGSVFWFSVPYKADHITAQFAKKEKECKLSFASKTFTNSDQSISEYNQSKYLYNFIEETKSKANFDNANNSERKITNQQLKDTKKSQHDIMSVYSKLSFINESDDETMKISEVEHKSMRKIECKPPSLNILLVEDSIPILKLTGSMLRKQGHIVTEAVHGEDALLKLEEVREDNGTTMKRFDVIITDLQMPVMDGFEFIKRLRKKEEDIQRSHHRLNDSVYDNDTQNSNSNNVPTTSLDSVYQPELIFVVSANSDEEIVDIAYDSGCDGVLEKPLNIQAFHKLYMEMKIQSS